MLTAIVKDDEHEPPYPSGSQEELYRQVDEETLITNHVSDNPSRHHIPKSSQKKRSSQKVNKFNKMLARDPRWVAHISAAKPRREAAPARLPIQRKRISEQRQIFWPNGAITKPPRRRCSAKKKHIGQMSSLVYCSYPPDNNAATKRLEKTNIPETKSNTVVTNGDILSTVFYRPSTSNKRSKENMEGTLPLSKSSTSNHSRHLKRETKSITKSNNSKNKIQISKMKHIQKVEIVSKTSKLKGVRSGIIAHTVPKRNGFPVVETVGDNGDLKTQKTSKFKNLNMGFQRPSTSTMTNRRKTLKTSCRGDIGTGFVAICKASTSSDGLSQNKGRDGKRHSKDSKTAKPQSKCDILATMFYRSSEQSKQSNSKKTHSHVKAKSTKTIDHPSVFNNISSHKKNSNDIGRRNDPKALNLSSKQGIVETMFYRPSKQWNTKEPRIDNDTERRLTPIKPSTSGSLNMVQNRNKFEVNQKQSTKRNSSQVVENTKEYFNRKHPKTCGKANKASKRKRLRTVEKQHEFEPRAKRAKMVKTKDKNETPSTSTGIVSSARRGHTDREHPPDIFKCMRKGRKYIKSRKRVRRKRKVEKDLCRLAQVRNALNIQREEDCDYKEAADGTCSNTNEETRNKGS